MALSLRDVTVELSGKIVVDAVSLNVDAGAITALLGPSGAGKTTLFRAIAGELSHRGTVELSGKNLGQLPLWKRARQGLGYLPQSASCLLDLTVRENLETFVSVTSATWQHAEALAGQLDLMALFDRRARQLSGGERRRLELLRALLVKPKVLLADEPLTAGDPKQARVIGERLQSLAASGSAVLVADHRVREILPWCRSAALMLGGRIELIKSADEFLNDSAVLQRYIN